MIKHTSIGIAFSLTLTANASAITDAPYAAGTLLLNTSQEPILEQTLFGDLTHQAVFFDAIPTNASTQIWNPNEAIADSLKESATPNIRVYMSKLYENMSRMVVVPEPNTITLCAIGFIALIFSRRRFKH